MTADKRNRTKAVFLIAAEYFIYSVKEIVYYLECCILRHFKNMLNFYFDSFLITAAVQAGITKGNVPDGR